MRRELQMLLRRAVRRLDPRQPVEVEVNRHRLLNGLADALCDEVERTGSCRRTRNEWYSAQESLCYGDPFPALDWLLIHCSMTFDAVPAEEAATSGPDRGEAS